MIILYEYLDVMAKKWAHGQGIGLLRIMMPTKLLIELGKDIMDGYWLENLLDML